MTSEEPKSILTPEEAKKLVDELVQEFLSNANRKTENISGELRWLLVARAANSIFCAIYVPTMTFAKDQIITKAKDLTL